MPIKIKVNEEGKYYYQWGNHGAKYFFNPNSEKSKDVAYEKAIKQVAAIFANNRKI